MGNLNGSATANHKPKFWKLKQRRAWNEQQQVITVAQTILGTPDLSFQSQIQVIVKAKELYDLAGVAEQPKPLNKENKE